MRPRVALLILALPLLWLAPDSLGLPVSISIAQNVERRGNGSNRDDSGRREGRGRRRWLERAENGDRGGPGERGSRDGRGDRINRADATSSTLPQRSTSSTSSTSTAAGSLSMEKYVQGLVRQYDKNGDMMLQPDEQKSLSGKAATADLDKDGVITVDELITTLSGNAPATSTPPAPAASARPAQSVSDADRDSQNSRSQPAAPGGPQRVFTALSAGSSTSSGDKPRRTYRFSRAADRLPATGLPGWFKSRDANGDGQISMSEYSRSWSNRMVDEFRRYDTNNDGLITPKEAAGK